ncbi:hypothetical protein BKA59DRAFT_473144 [Fusarium tricinctum]|jgi:hypothetical protein|uniref:Uncharacterized protein n=1 Tax=Fusarium tricinctum TaxID=61284 RepID=A0A8K0S1A7_9HYPO|nr:hypothetical protein BKA59DRAFT_473144 [Fusarium tricinctum]
MVRLCPSAICLVSFLGEETAARNNTYTSIRYESVFYPLFCCLLAWNTRGSACALGSKGTVLHVYLATLYVLSSASNITYSIRCKQGVYLGFIPIFKCGILVYKFRLVSSSLAL